MVAVPQIRTRCPNNYGGPGDDTLRGGDEADRIYGGSGDDTCTSGETTAGCEHHSDTR